MDFINQGDLREKSLLFDNYTYGSYPSHAANIKLAHTKWAHTWGLQASVKVNWLLEILHPKEPEHQELRPSWDPSPRS